MTETAWIVAFVKAYTSHPSDDCIRWTHSIATSGYGRAGRYYAHRLLYFAFKGPIPEGLQIDHLCGQKDCVNADHLEAVPGIVNTRRHYAKRTECKNGHPRTPENIIRQRGRNYCLPCNQEYSKQQAARQLAARRAARAAGPST